MIVTYRLSVLMRHSTRYTVSCSDVVCVTHAQFIVKSERKMATMSQSTLIFVCMCILISTAHSYTTLLKVTIKHHISSLHAHNSHALVPTSSSVIVKESLLSKLAIVSTVMTLLPKASYAAVKENYLSEPTLDFQEQEKLTKELQAVQAKQRSDWDAISAKLDAAETTEDKLACLKAYIAYLKPLDGIPQGVKKLELVKLCRKKKLIGTSRKPQPTWTTECEIAYQELIQLFNVKMLPNNRVEANPF